MSDDCNAAEFVAKLRRAEDRLNANQLLGESCFTESTQLRSPVHVRLQPLRIRLKRCRAVAYERHSAGPPGKSGLLVHIPELTQKSVPTTVLLVGTLGVRVSSRKEPNFSNFGASYMYALP